MSRIVAGAAKGRRLGVPPGSATRPTADRTREALFSSLHSLRGELTGASFLDLYAGSGAVGLEAASRGASRVLLVEREERALRTLRANVEVLALPGVRVQAGSVATLLTTAPPEPFDVVFCDPPYAVDLAPVIESLAHQHWLTTDAVVVAERSVRSGPVSWPSGLREVQQRRYGDTLLCYGSRS